MPVRSSPGPCCRRTWGLTVVGLVIGASLLLHGQAWSDPPDDEPTPVWSVFITEIMYNPPAGVDAEHGQWIEIYNDSEEQFDASGMVISVTGCDTVPGTKIHAVSGAGAPLVPPGGFTVLGTSKAQALNGGVVVAYSYGPGLLLPAAGAVVSLSHQGNLLDEVAFGPEPGLSAPQGHSLNLEPAGMSPEDNDFAPFWCVSAVEDETATALLFGTPWGMGHDCDSDEDGYDESQGDCDDTNGLVAPGIQEKCNGVDDDCDGYIDEENADEPLAGRPPGMH